MAGNGASTMLELALSFEGVDPNLPDNEGNTPLHFAAQAGECDYVMNNIAWWINISRYRNIIHDAYNMSEMSMIRELINFVIL